MTGNWVRKPSVVQRKSTSSESKLTTYENDLSDQQAVDTRAAVRRVTRSLPPRLSRIISVSSVRSLLHFF